MWRMAVLSLSGPSAPSDVRFGRPLRCSNAVGGDAGHVPEQVELEDAVEPRQAGQSPIRERPVHEQAHRTVAVGLRVGR